MHRIFQGWMVVLLFLSGTAVGEELHTVAYVMDEGMFRDLARGEWTGRAQSSPFEDEEDLPKLAFTVAVPAKAPIRSRFFESGHDLLSVTGQLQEADYLQGEESWGIYNKATGRLVVRSSDGEHASLAHNISFLLGNSPRLVSIRTELYAVPCREFGAVEWSAEEVKARGAKSVVACSVLTRSGQQAHSRHAGGNDEAQVSLGAEPSVGLNYTIVEVQVDWNGVLKSEGSTRRLSFKAGVSIYSGSSQFVEVGAAPEEGVVYLLEIGGNVRFMDGTPVTEVWIDEAGERAGLAWPRKSAPRKNLAKGLEVGVYAVPPTFGSDLEGSGAAAEDDPFADSVVSNSDVKKGRPRVEAPVQAPYLGPRDFLFDVRDILSDRGVRVPDEGWALFNATQSLLVVAADPADLDLVEVLVEGGCVFPPRMISVTMSTVQETKEWSKQRWERGECAIVARIGGVVRPGQKVVVSDRLTGRDEELVRGLALTLEGNIGANDWIIDLQWILDLHGETAGQAKSAVTVNDGRFLYVPIGKQGDRHLGVVVEAHLVDGTGARIRE